MSDKLTYCYKRILRLVAMQLGLWGGITVISASLGLAPGAGMSEQQAPAVLPSPPQAKDQRTTSAPPAQQTHAKAVVPFEMSLTNHMLVQARINGKGPYLLIFDLGAPITLLNNRASEAAGVVKADMPRSFLLGMRGEAEVGKLEVGSLTATKLPVVVLDHPVLKALGQIIDRQIDGIMGFTFFARYKTTIDYVEHRMTFEPVNFEVKNLLKELPERLLGPKVARRQVLTPSGLWGVCLGKPVRDLVSPGVSVARVYPGSPAARAGLKPGDVLTTLNGRWITSIADVFQAAADVEPGGDAALVILRAGKEQTLTIHPADGI
jgi:PDZ domain/Aspartyl protease